MPTGVYKKSEEHRKKLGLANKGRKFNLTSEQRKKISVAKKGKKFSQKHLKNLLDSRIKRNGGNILSDETKKKISDSLKIAYKEGRKTIQIGNVTSKESRRKNSEAHLREKNWNWKGGISFLPYPVDWTRTLRISIRERDKYICKLCGDKQGDTAHHVHHIDYDKKNCNSNNLITLCAGCHRKTNHNREYWIEYFNMFIVNNS